MNASIRDFVKRRVTFGTLAAVSALSAFSAFAANPFLPLWEYVPDGEPHVFEDPDCPGKMRVYLYGSHDMRKTGYCGYDQVVWSASVDDLNAWRCEGVSFESVTGADGKPLNKDGSADRLYAPDVTLRTGVDGAKEYCLYPYIRNKLRYGAVAKSSHPAGPFKVCNWSKDNPKRAVGVMGPDPAVFTDEDGRVYGYWGFNRSFAAELDPETMATPKPGTKIVTDMVSGWKQPGVFRFYEASSMRKIGGKYVFIYSRYTMPGESGLDASPYTLAYAYSDRPLGPWTFGGTLIDARAPEMLPDGTAIATAAPGGNTHGSLCEINGEWFLFYHRQTGTNEFSRQAMVAHVTVEVEERPGGAVEISQAEYDSMGFETGGLDPFALHAAGIACHYTGPRKAMYKWPNCFYSGPYPEPFRMDGYEAKDPYDPKVNKCALVHCTDGSVAGYKYFDFAKTHGRKGLRLLLELEPMETAGSVDIWVTKPAAEEGGVKIGSFKVGSDRPGEIRTLNIPVDALSTVDGRQPLWFTFASPEKGKSICTLRAFRFKIDERHVSEAARLKKPQESQPNYSKLQNDPTRKQQ